MKRSTRESQRFEVSSKRPINVKTVCCLIVILRFLILKSREIYKNWFFHCVFHSSSQVALFGLLGLVSRLPLLRLCDETDVLGSLLSVTRAVWSWWIWAHFGQKTAPASPTYVELCAHWDRDVVVAVAVAVLTTQMGGKQHSIRFDSNACLATGAASSFHLVIKNSTVAVLLLTTEESIYSMHH